MKKQVVQLVKLISSKDVRNTLREHGIDVLNNHIKKTVEVIVDKKYAVHVLMRSANLKFLLEAVEELHGKGYKTSLKAIVHGTHHDREMKIPHAIHI